MRRSRQRFAVGSLAADAAHVEALLEQLESRTLAAADLAVERLDFPSGSTDDPSLEIGFEVRNRGDADPGEFVLTIGLTLDQVIGNGDDVVLGESPVSGLMRGFSISTRSDYDTPPSVPPGVYFGFCSVRLESGADADPANDSLLTASRVFRSGDAAGRIEVSGAGQWIPPGDVTPRFADHTHFGKFRPTTPYRNRAFVITNVGEGALDLASVRIDGPGAASFSIKTYPASTLLAGDSSKLIVSFDPVSSGRQNATITINSSSSDDPAYQFAIRGRGIDPGLVRLTFGARIVVSEGQTVGSPVALSEWSGSGDPMFVLINTGPRKVWIAGAEVRPYGVPPFYQTHPRFEILDNPTGYLRRGASMTFRIVSDGPSEIGILNFNVYLGGFWATQIGFVLDD